MKCTAAIYKQSDMLSPALHSNNERSRNISHKTYQHRQMQKLLTSIFLLFVSIVFAQKDLKETAEGNANFSDKKLIDAEADYREAISYNGTNYVPQFNLGNTLYRDEQVTAAEQRYKEAAAQAVTKADKHKAYHNLGNSYMLQKRYQEAVEAYKNALRNNPTDDETRYNLALAKQKQEQEGGGGGGGEGDDKDQNKEQNQQDKKEGDQNKDNQNKGDQDKKDPNKPEDKQGDQPKDPGEQKEQPAQPKPQQGQMSPQQIKNLLKAAENEEKKSQEKLQLEKMEGQPKKTEKDW